MPLPTQKEAPRRIQVQEVSPQVDGGRYAAKACVGDNVAVSARIFRDGHEVLGGAVRYRAPGGRRWLELPLEPRGNDVWTGAFPVDRCGLWRFAIDAWVDRFASWRWEIERKFDAGQEDLSSELAEGALLLGVESLTVE